MSVLGNWAAGGHPEMALGSGRESPPTGPPGSPGSSLPAFGCQVLAPVLRGRDPSPRFTDRKYRQENRIVKETGVVRAATQISINEMDSP